MVEKRTYSSSTLKEIELLLIVMKLLKPQFLMLLNKFTMNSLNFIIKTTNLYPAHFESHLLNLSLLLLTLTLDLEDPPLLSLVRLLPILASGKHHRLIL